MNRKAFTLVELLAVIVVLGIILLIAVPKVITTINNSKLASMNDTTRMIAAQAEREYASRSSLNLLDQTNDPITCDDVTTLSTNDYTECSISFDGGSAYVNISGKGNLDGLICTNGNRLDGKCGKIVNVYQESILNGAYPRVIEGMIPVTIANNGTVTTVDSSSSSWYNYTNKQWANIVLVKESGTQTRSYYQTHNGVTVVEGDILAYLVWIPRYRYTLWNVTGTAATNAGGCSLANYYNKTACEAGGATWTDLTCSGTNCPRSISITFENASTVKSAGTTNGTQRTHPAFTYNGIELNGIWVGKFETTQGTVSNVGITNPTIKPNITSWRNQSISTEFATSLLFSSTSLYGLTGESRVSKSSDWGATVYLSHSQYGVDTEIRVNNNLNFTTGCGGSVAHKAATTNCEISYGGAGSYPQSTTGNIYGVFDINGGAGEYQMGLYTDSDNTLYSGTCDIYNSGYKGLYGFPTQTDCDPDITSNTTGLDFPNTKYYKLYTYSSWASKTSNLGEALGETNKWYEDHNQFVDDWYPWLVRGGRGDIGRPSGAFNFRHAEGSGDDSTTFRTIVTIS